MRFRFHLGHLAIAAALFLPSHAQATHELVKLAGNPATYFLGDDGRRYVFPNAATYASWYAGGVPARIVGADEMASYPLGSNVTYRPGVRMMKIQTDPKVYVVAKGGMLRHVTSEALASCLYGPDWARKVDDVPDVFFADYRLGAPIASCAEFSPASESAAAPTIADDKGIGSHVEAPLPATPAFSVSGASASTLADREVMLLHVRIETASPLRLKRIPIIVSALTSAPKPPGVWWDEDPGGLIRGAGAEANLRRLRIVDGRGAIAFGEEALSLDMIRDQSQELDFNGSFDVPVGVTTLHLMAYVDDGVPSGEQYRAGIRVAGIVLEDVSGAAQRFTPASDLFGGVLQTGTLALDVTPLAIPHPAVAVRGAADAAVAAYVFRASAVSETTIRALTFQGYLDEQEGAPGFKPGGDMDDGTWTAVRDILPTVSLTDSRGVRLAGPVPVGLDGRAEFRNLHITLPAGGAMELDVRGDVPLGAEIGAGPDLVAFDLADPSRDVDAVDAAGARVEPPVAPPNGGANPAFYLTARQHGAFSLAWKGAQGFAIAGVDNWVGSLKLTAQDDAYVLRELPFVSIGAAADDPLRSLLVSYRAADGRMVTAEAGFGGIEAVFTGLAVPVAKDSFVDLQIYAILADQDASKASGRRLQIRLAEDRTFVFDAAAERRSFAGSMTAPASPLRIASNAPADMTVRWTALTAAPSLASPTGAFVRGHEVEVLRFALSSHAAGDARVRKLAFQLSPQDGGTAGADNDAVERWADIDGDAPDDNDVISLRRFLGDGSYETVGEDATASIRYAIYRKGARDATPAGLDSMTGDAGIVEVEFASGSGLVIPAGATVEFALAIDTAAIEGVDEPFEARLLGGADFAWSDSSSDHVAPFDGGEVRGLPVISRPLRTP